MDVFFFFQLRSLSSICIKNQEKKNYLASRGGFTGLGCGRLPPSPKPIPKPIPKGRSLDILLKIVFTRFRRRCLCSLREILRCENASLLRPQNGLILCLRQASATMYLSIGRSKIIVNPPLKPRSKMQCLF